MPKRISSQRTARSPRIHTAKTVRTDQFPADRPFAPGYGIVGPQDGLGLLPWTWVARKMNPCRTFWLATVRPGTVHATQARPHVMPVWGVWLEDAFFFSTGRKSRKGQNLAANPACTIANDDGKEAVIVEGQAQELVDAAALERVASAYKKKYKMDPRGMGEPIFKVEPMKVFAFIEKSFPKSATRWKV
ncbi:MAG: pyridoxamine 5'-phosphate oxidase family protein [Terriglobales bacterium]|jgi:nitroimidazol reductase NimA-like FMN-containing flavoprotein (pyridoxamine 5'-phosphate oxidase superfamily)